MSGCSGFEAEYLQGLTPIYAVFEENWGLTLSRGQLLAISTPIDYLTLIRPAPLTSRFPPFGLPKQLTSPAPEISASNVSLA